MWLNLAIKLFKRQHWYSDSHSVYPLSHCSSAWVWSFSDLLCLQCQVCSVFQHNYFTYKLAIQETQSRTHTQVNTTKFQPVVHARRVQHIYICTANLSASFVCTLITFSLFAYFSAHFRAFFINDLPLSQWWWHAWCRWK